MSSIIAEILVLARRYMGWAALVSTVVLAAGADARAVIGGRPAESDDWPEVVGLMYRGETGLEAGCTGTLIAPRVVITAAHCLAHPGGVSDADPVAVRFGSLDLARGGRDVPVRRVRAMSDGLDGFDLGLVFLGQDAPVAPVKLARGCARASVGARVELVGYGVTDDGTYGVLHRASLKVARLVCRDDALGCATGRTGGRYLVTNPSGMCGGDSGGPVFVVNEHGRFLAGVASGPTSDEASDDCSDWRRAIYARPDTVVAWIERQIGSKLSMPACAPPKD